MFQVSSGVLFLFFEIKCDQASPGVLIFVWDKSYLSIHGLFSFFEELGLDQCFHPGMFHLFIKFLKLMILARQAEHPYRHFCPRTPCLITGAPFFLSRRTGLGDDGLE